MHICTDTDIDVDTHMCPHAHACTDACMHAYTRGHTHTNAHRSQFPGHTGVHQLSACAIWFKNLHDVYKNLRHLLITQAYYYAIFISKLCVFEIYTVLVDTVATY